MAMYTDAQIQWQLNRYGGNTHPDHVIAQWEKIDEVLRMQHPIRMPTAAAMESVELSRLHLHTNYARVVVQSTVTLTLANDITVYGSDGLIDRTDLAQRLFPQKLVRRMLRYMSTYGAAWRLRRPSDRKMPLRVYKPSIAREIPLESDPEVVKAVLAIEKVEKRNKPGSTSDDHYYVARWYEWDDSESPEPSDWTKVIRRVYTTEQLGGSWRHDAAQDYAYSYMPMELVRNRDTDELFEASDVYDALELFMGMDDLTVKYLKALEDEAFRLLILANVTSEQAQGINTIDGGNVVTISNGTADLPEPRPYWMDPADHRQYLEAFSELLRRISTVTRTSLLELGESPEGDIPAQTLRVKYGPQLERVKESAEYASIALTEDLTQLGHAAGAVRLIPALPVSEDKLHQNRKGLLDVGAYSRKAMLLDEGRTPAEADRIIQEYLAEQKAILEMEADAQLIVEERVAEIAASASESRMMQR